MFEFKSISRESIPLALEKAERYRLLNEPDQAESICLDVLAVDPDNQQALVSLLLALTEQFPTGSADCFNQAKAAVARLPASTSGSTTTASSASGSATRSPSVPRRAARRRRTSGFAKALEFYAQAERLARRATTTRCCAWNSCLRLCQRYHLGPRHEEALPPVLGDD